MILRRVALVDQDKIGLGISVFVSVETADHSEAWLQNFATPSRDARGDGVLPHGRRRDYMLRVVVDGHAEL